MSDKERLKIKKKNEMRTKDISRMIDEGGLGADKYYEITKGKQKDNEATNNRNEASQEKGKDDD
ncbi:hypothetical protein ACLIBG_09190 [Virgibacillus sp. W0181]|uniref:hypothetical protein n=1 Tax=Virgibacillus sp. W0181 TaxID=3391581 RepID=UPI003F485262